MSESDRIIQALEQIISDQAARISEQEQTIRDLRNTVDDLRTTIANLNETLNELKRKLFGTSREKAKDTPAGDKQEDTVTIGEETEVTVKEHTRTRKPKSTRRDIYESLPIERVECPVPDELRNCPDCDTPMEHLGYKFVREELRVYPAKVTRVRYYQETLVCPACREEGDTTITKAPVPTPLLSHSPASPSMVANVMYDKSGIHLPFYRQEKDWILKGLPIPRETMANWYNKCALLYLKPVYEFLHQCLIQRDIIHADEVPCQVLHEEGKTPQSKSYMWIYMTGTDGKPGIVLYDYQPGRKGDYPIEFLSGYKGIVQCDGYSAYGRLDDVILACCLAHCRRKFFEAVPGERRKKLKLLDINSEQAIPKPVENISGRTDMTPGEKGVEYCNRLFYKERSYKDLPADERKARRLETELPIWEEFWKWLETLDPVGGSKLEKAITYAVNHKESLMNYLQDGRCEISNNAAERKAKVYATSRKNFLFHDTTDGATASAIVLSIIETAKANGLNAFQYLYMLLLYMPDYLNEPAGIEKLLPWSDLIQESCKGPSDTEKIRPENRGKLPL